MIVLGCNNISLSFGVTTILKDISFSINDTDKVGVVGVNGAGKSTLFKIIAANTFRTAEKFIQPKTQNSVTLHKIPVWTRPTQYWKKSWRCFPTSLKWESRIKDLEKSMSTEKDENQLNSIMKEYSRLTDEYAVWEGLNIKARKGF